MPPKKERTPELRQRLLDAAIDLLADQGVAAVTTRNVAAHAGTTAPAIYELFTDKAGLVRAVFFEGFRQLGTALAALPDPTGSADDVAMAADAFRTFARSHPRLFEVMYTQPFGDFQPDHDEQVLGQSTRELLVDRARRCVEAGTLRGDPVDIAHAVLGLAIGLATQETAGWLGSTPAACDRRWHLATRALVGGLAC